MDWKEDTCESLEEEEGWSTFGERESGVVVGNEVTDAATVEDGVTVEEEEEEDEGFLGWCLLEREEELEDVEDDVDGCLKSALTEE
jgi:hypothetical protein